VFWEVSEKDRIIQSDLNEMTFKLGVRAMKSDIGNVNMTHHS